MLNNNFKMHTYISSIKVNYRCNKTVCIQQFNPSFATKYVRNIV